MKPLRLLLVILTATTLLAQARLDSNQMRNDLFAAMDGNADALKRVLDASQKVLTENSDHAQALVWHGAAMLGGSFMEAQKGNPLDHRGLVYASDRVGTGLFILQYTGSEN